MESSPRFRTTDSRPEYNSTNPYHHTTSPLAPPSPPPPKLRLMCSTGGQILPRPHDKSLRYVGGETRIVGVDRHTTLLELTQRISKTLIKTCYSSPQTSHASLFTLKYLLPSEDLDSLISVTTDEDVENMIDEHERLNSSSRIRLFVFPTNPESGSVGSFLENPSKSEDWFLNALNGTGSGFSDTSSVNCLLDLDDEISLPEKKDHKPTIDANLRGNNTGQDVNSIPDSGQETTSSFGSASSTPSHANLPPISVNTDLMGLHSPVAVSGSPVSSATVIKEESDPFLCFGEKSGQGLEMGYVKHHQQQSTGFDLASMDSIMSDLTITDQSSPVSQIHSSSSDNPNNTHDQNTRTQIQQHHQQQQQQVYRSAHLISMPTTQVESPRHQSHHQQPPQFIPPQQYIHHHPAATVPVTSYYQHHPHLPPTDQQNFMYYIPSRQPPQGYSFPLQQPQHSHSDTPPAAATNARGPQLVRVLSGYQNQPQHVGYSQMHQPSQSMYYAPSLSNAQYQEMTTVSPVEAGLRKQQVRTAQP